jgi:polyhydroxyalkanoate synthesis regulator phasin
MDDLFKKFINTGVGFLSQGNKRVQLALDKLVQESKISEHEGKKIMDDLLKSGETKRKDLEKQLQALAGNLRDRAGLGAEAEATPPTKAKAAPKKPAAKAATAKKTADKEAAPTAKPKRPAAAKKPAAESEE